MRELFGPELLLVLVAVSVATFVGSILGLPFILVRMRADHFTNPHPPGWFADRHPILRVLGHAVKNAAGLVLLLAGIGMLFLPGQGLLTIMAGLFLLEFPGKRRLELAIVGRPRVLRGVNRLRRRFGRDPLLLPRAEADPPASPPGG